MDAAAAEDLLNKVADQVVKCYEITMCQHSTYFDDQLMKKVFITIHMEKDFETALETNGINNKLP